MYFDYAENQTERKNPMHMKDWEEKLNAFLRFSEREILTNAGNISNAVAKELAQNKYEKYKQQRFDIHEKDDFDVFLEENEWTNKKR